MSTLQKQINLIKQEKDTKILPENIRQGVTIFNVTRYNDRWSSHGKTI